MDPLREQLIRVLDWEEAHATFDKAVAGLPAGKRGVRPAAFEHSPWQLLEHLRLALSDILDFARNPQYVHALTWPDDYWPKDPEPPSATAWDASIAGFKADLEAVKALVRDPKVDLYALVPKGKGQQTVLRAVMLVIDHNAYHVGQLVAVRKALEAW